MRPQTVPLHKEAPVSISSSIDSYDSGLTITLLTVNRFGLSNHIFPWLGVSLRFVVLAVSAV